MLLKGLGGLGIHNLDARNSACLLKLGWHLKNGGNDLWCKVLLGKYGRNVNVERSLSVQSKDTSLWKNLVDLWPQIASAEFWAVGDGISINAWDDKWLSSKDSLSNLVASIHDACKSWQVKDLSSASGNWNLELLRELLPYSISKKIMPIVPPSSSNGSDTRL